jgi:malic enzyme
MIIKKFELRHKIGNKMRERIIPTITKSLNSQSKNIKDHEVLMFGDGAAEVTIATIRHAINLGENIKL